MQSGRKRSFRKKERGRRALRRLAATTAGVAAAAMALNAAPALAATGGQAVHATVGATSSGPSPVFGNSYYMASRTGAVWPLGSAPNYGSALGLHLAAPIVGITMTPDKKGYWLVAGDGGVFSFGDAHFYGSTGGMRLDKPVIGLAPTPDGKGYWLFAGDGGVFAFGDARFHGSTGAMRLDQPVVGMAATSDGKGYWLFAGDGGMFAFGDARFYGSTGNMKLVAPVVAMTPTNDGKGYWLMASDGGVFAFGDAGFHGSLSGSGQVGAEIVADSHGTGYWEVDHQGDVYPFGSAATHQIPTVALFHTILTPADQAMEWAMSQIGKPYQWGGAGPNSYDCSGLVMRAWESVGVNLPRVAADQYDYGTHVAIANLRLGDLVYWATNPAQPSTIEHVAMYIGGDHIVEAPHTGTDVQTNWSGGGGFVDLGTRP